MPTRKELEKRIEKEERQSKRDINKLSRTLTASKNKLKDLEKRHEELAKENRAKSAIVKEIISLGSYANERNKILQELQDKPRIDRYKDFKKYAKNLENNPVWRLNQILVEIKQFVSDVDKEIRDIDEQHEDAGEDTPEEKLEREAMKKRLDAIGGDSKAEVGISIAVGPKDTDEKLAVDYDSLNGLARQNPTTPKPPESHSFLGDKAKNGYYRVEGTSEKYLKQESRFLYKPHSTESDSFTKTLDQMCEHYAALGNKEALIKTDNEFARTFIANKLNGLGITAKFPDGTKEPVLFVPTPGPRRS